MKSTLRLSALLLGLIASLAVQADQFALPFGWTGGYGVLGQCLLSNGPVTKPSWQACPGGGGGSGTVTSLIAGTGLTGGTITTSGTIALSTPIADGSLSTNIPLLNAANTFTAVPTISATEPRLKLIQTGAATDAKLWDLDLLSSALCIRTRNDADNAGHNILCATRTGTTALSAITVGNATDNASTTILGNGTVTVNGRVVLPLSLTSAGTKPTVTGCSNTTTLGGAVGGSFLSGTSGTCTVTITLPTGPTNGYACFAHDDTTTADYTQSAIVTSVNTLTISGTTVSGDKIVWGCPLGY